MVCVRIGNGIPFLVIKFIFRENPPMGFVLRRPCICTKNSSSAHPFSPIHVLWGRIRPRTVPYELAFAALTKRNFNPILKATFDRASAPDALLFATHCFRRGATQALKTANRPHPC